MQLCESLSETGGGDLHGQWYIRETRPLKSKLCVYSAVGCFGGASACLVDLPRQSVATAGALAKTDPREPGLMGCAAKIGSPVVSPHQFGSK
jgi:hypothetical protein